MGEYVPPDVVATCIDAVTGQLVFVWVTVTAQRFVTSPKMCVMAALLQAVSSVSSSEVHSYVKETVKSLVTDEGVFAVSVNL